MSKKKIFKILALSLLIASLPIALIVSRQTQDNRSSAAAADKLEAEGGVLANNTTVKQDSQASGGSYVELGQNQTNTPTPIPTSAPQSGAYGPRSAPARPTGSHVYIMPNGNGIDLTGVNDSSAGINSWLNSVPNGTASQHSIIVIPSGSTLRLGSSINISSSRRYLTFFMYGATLNKVGSFSDSGTASTFKVMGANNIKFFGGTINGGWTGGGTNAWGGDTAHGITFWHGVNDTEVADMTFNRQFADGIYYSGWNSSQSNNAYIHHNLFYQSGRQNLTLNGGGNDALVEYNIFREPALGGIDYEDTNGTDLAPQTRNRNTIRNNWFDGWSWYVPGYNGQGNYGMTPPIQLFLRDTTIDQPLDRLTIENNLFTKGWLGNGRTSNSCPTDTGIIELAQRWAGTNTSSHPCGITTQKTNLVVRNNTFNLPNGSGGRCETQASNKKQAIRASNSVNMTIANNNFQGMSIYYASFVSPVNSYGCGGQTVPAASGTINVSGNQ